jgi:hypothetical protein
MVNRKIALFGTTVFFIMTGVQNGKKRQDFRALVDWK